MEYYWLSLCHCISTYDASCFHIFSNLAVVLLTLKVLVVTTDAQWEGMGDVGSARYEPALLPSCPTIRVLSYSNCQRAPTPFLSECSEI